MKVKALLGYLSIGLIVATTACSSHSEEVYSHIPSLDEMPGEWVSADTADMEPSIRNFRGQALTNRDINSVSWFVSAPYSGGYHTGRLRINGQIPEVHSFRWQAWQALREAEWNGLKLSSSTRMPISKDGLMWEITIKNASDEARRLDLELDMIGFNSQYGGEWQWWYPYPKMDGRTTNRDEEVENVRKYFNEDFTSMETVATELVGGKPQQKKVTLTWPSDREILQSDKYRSQLLEETVLVSDQETAAKTAFIIADDGWEYEVLNSGATGKKMIELEAGESYTLRYVMTVNQNLLQAVADARLLSDEFGKQFQQIEEEWKNRWQEIFKPDNELLSGAFPVLATDDSLAKRVYYTGPLTMLYLMNENLPQHDKVFLTGGPRWGASITFFWDITEWSTLWAVVDPAMMREHLASWIKIDPSLHYGKDNISGVGVGNGYSANYWALFQMIRSYLTVSNDYAFLDEVIDGKTVYEHLQKYALNWKEISIYGQEGAREDIYKLADFGDDEWNLLEAVPTYKHIVPSFNAAYIWMMRETADLAKMKGDSAKAKNLRAQSDEMMERLLKLYAGDGVWNSLYPDGKTIEVRHSLDFMFLGRYVQQDIPEDIKQEMMDFLYRELITNHWMRAQSLQDVAAEDSDRPDHGPLGAFDGWPAGTMDALTQLGYPDKALDFYHNIAPVTREGIWAQAHELWGENKREKNARVRIAQRGWHNRESSSGIAMSQVMLKNFFGFYPDVNGPAIIDQDKPDFSGTLYNVKYGDTYYTLTAKDGKVEMAESEHMEE
ncbi:hypothetical protein [Gracilimonas mengyeensis]|uniref:Alpha-L-rhamnosidase six-hairpin glycosidase domain-containing protein n=1 Tax=Gracilimonas mengyeensis TaxID=1302730 RepID=A0A521EYL6_9BACT|nr:hypothetical protein [Gracilimonas mengyeensis]SMO88985.1 hypothetical protein SAMN06265219_11442 [Gracilimonas mengyeensis]